MAALNCKHYSACFAIAIHILGEYKANIIFDARCKNSCIWYNERDNIGYLLDKYMYTFINRLSGRRTPEALGLKHAWNNLNCKNRLGGSEMNLKHWRKKLLQDYQDYEKEVARDEALYTNSGENY